MKNSILFIAWWTLGMEWKCKFANVISNKKTPWNSFGLIKCPFEWICSHFGIWFQFSIEIHQPTFSSLLFKVSQHTVGADDNEHMPKIPKKNDEKWINSHSKYLNMHIQMRNENRLNFQYFHLFSEFYFGLYERASNAYSIIWINQAKFYKLFPSPSPCTPVGVVHAAHG